MRTLYSLPEELEGDVRAELEAWRRGSMIERLWQRDASLWTDSHEDRWLGWLTVTSTQFRRLGEFSDFSQEVQRAGFTHILLLGMGGSVLCPEVLAATFGQLDDWPELCVLDSTDPAQVRTLERHIDLPRTLFFVSSKSGTTLEPTLFKQHFFERVQQVLGPERVGWHFVAITDPGSKLHALARRDGFRRVFFGEPNIGGRYSALSDFGLVPAAAMGLDVGRLLTRAEEAIEACCATVPVDGNPGALLGILLGVLGRQGRDKVTFVASPGIRSLGSWLEQLIAESTGKQGKALLPVDGEEPGPPSVYGTDRVFVYLRLDSSPDPSQDSTIAALEEAAQPLVRISVRDLYDLGREFFRWEFATAVAGSILGVNPFDQPDVEASKVATRKLTAECEASGRLPPETPLLEEDGLQLFTDEVNAAALSQALEGPPAIANHLRAHLDRLGAGDYFALLSYLERNPEHLRELQAMRHAVRDGRRVATNVGFGPRFLHSTGQAHKGGPNSAVVLQITCDDTDDLPVPGHGYTFGAVKAAQARGDFEVLAQRRRRLLRVHLKGRPAWGLRRLRELLAEAARPPHAAQSRSRGQE